MNSDTMANTIRAPLEPGESPRGVEKISWLSPLEISWGYGMLDLTVARCFQLKERL
jgi:hypothetical protein